MRRLRVGILAAWIGFAGIVLAALINVFARSTHHQSMKVEGSLGSKNTQVSGNYISKEINNSPGSTIITGDQNNYYSDQQIDRPYLLIELCPGPNEYLKKDGNSQLYFDSLYNNNFLILPFQVRNIGKIHTNRNFAEYSSPTQQHVSIELGEKSSFLGSGETISETFRPHINISSIINNEATKEFNTEIVLKYKNYDNKDMHTYTTTLELSLVKIKSKENSTIYLIKEKKLQFNEE